jgi:hypothetical protein
MWTLNKLWFFLCAFSALSLACRAEVTTNSPADTNFRLETPPPHLWEAGVGEGFRASAQTASLEAGAVNGIALLGGSEAHDLVLTSVSYGHMLNHTVGEGHFYRGNWELRGELFGGVEFSPSSEWVIGLAPHLRYNFATGTRFVPYFDAGAGVTATSIGPPDLSNIFEFNLQATVGTQVFLRDNLALTLEARYLHLSCAGISNPNRGLNGVAGLVGLAFLF